MTARELLHQARALDRSQPINVFGGFHPIAKIEAAGILINPGLLQPDQGADSVPAFKVKATDFGPCPGLARSLHARPNDACRGTKPNAAFLCAHFNTSRLQVKLNSVMRAIRSGDDNALHSNWIGQI